MLTAITKLALSLVPQYINNLIVVSGLYQTILQNDKRSCFVIEDDLYDRVNKIGQSFLAHLMLHKNFKCYVRVWRMQY